MSVYRASSTKLCVLINNKDKAKNIYIFSKVQFSCIQALESICAEWGLVHWFQAQNELKHIDSKRRMNFSTLIPSKEWTLAHLFQAQNEL